MIKPGPDLRCDAWILCEGKCDSYIYEQAWDDQTKTKCQFGTRLREHQKAVFFCKKVYSALSENTCLTNHTIGWDNSKIITTNRRYHQHLCLEAWHINSVHAPLNRDDGSLLPEAIYTSSEKRPLLSDHIKGPLVAVFISPLMKALDRSVETLGLWIVTSLVTFIKSVNQSSIKLCLIVHLVAMWTLI